MACLAPTLLVGRSSRQTKEFLECLDSLPVHFSSQISADIAEMPRLVAITGYMLFIWYVAHDIAVFIGVIPHPGSSRRTAKTVLGTGTDTKINCPPCLVFAMARPGTLRIGGGLAKVAHFSAIYAGLGSVGAVTAI